MSYRYRIAAIFLLGFFIDCINIFMSAIALPEIAGQLHIASGSLGWVANSYILGLTVIIPVSGWLAARYGARPVLAGSMLLFSLAALGCGVSETFGSLVLWRFIQGMAGGMLIPVGQALTFNLFKGRERATISTLIMSVALIAPALSPMLGGMIVDSLSWRWIFWCNIPFSLMAAVLAVSWVRRETLSVSKPDIRGILLVCLSLTTVLLGLSRLAEAGSVIPAALWLSASLVLALGYLFHYRNHPYAVIDLSLLRNSRLRLSVVVYYAVPGIFTGVNLLNIFYLQQCLHFSAERCGAFMLLYGGGALVAMLLCGRFYHRLGAVTLFSFGLVMHAAGIALLALVHTPEQVMLLNLAYLLMGVGGGVSANTAQTSALADFHDEQMTRASVIWNINRQLSFSLGAALFTLLFTLLSSHFSAVQAYRQVFIIAAVAGLIPLWIIFRLHRYKDSLCQN
ncbi:MFS transporter [Erwinia sorbitola]|uniref:MFS transporter n=1 Tax=Erwinia sorbitola TaxID=2681984 RepID=A0A6I6EEV2_9GAMM|nr:MFS transporter [Erwinia sorbitola]QGU88404.1 MFS transporter [Erwinia sorbitola]